MAKHWQNVGMWFGLPAVEVLAAAVFDRRGGSGLGKVGGVHTSAV
jgi:hypothetical protein